jgi:steroid 5-alpha reductase family enzyme
MEILFEHIGVVALLLFIFVTGVFFLSQALEDNSIMDIFYGPAFFFAAFMFLIMTDIVEPLPVIITTIIGLWAVRLGGRLLLKNFGQPEDARYAKWRTEWLLKGKLYFILRSYLQVNLLQAVVILLILLPFIISTVTPSFSLPYVILGAIVSLFGLTYETIADMQLDKYIARKKAGLEESPLMTKGLFKFSRRPNYFGESLVWWGQAIMVFPLPFGILGILSPLIITHVVVNVTGPMLEKIFLEKYPEEYRHYMATTNYLVPSKPKTPATNPESA